MSADAQATVPPTAIGRVLGVVRRLIDYGRQLTGTLQQRAAAPDFARFARPFGTTDLAVILTRITNGLRRAAPLDARLSRRAARGQDLPVSTVPAIRLPAVRRPRTTPRQAAPPGARTRRWPLGQFEDPRLARLLTEAEIAAEVRRRPVGAVIADICSDLGIMPRDLDRAFWLEIRQAVILYRGSLIGHLATMAFRWCVFRVADRNPAALPPLPALATGPP